jgi:hypothetical protein
LVAHRVARGVTSGLLHCDTRAGVFVNHYDFGGSRCVLQSLEFGIE